MKTLAFGETTVERIVEIDTLWFDPASFYPELEPRTIERYAHELGPRLIHPETKKIALSFHSYLIRTPRLNILVDTCNGNHKPRGPKVAWQDRLASHTYLENLARAGLRPEDIDLVLCTHLHTDHVGWNTCLRDGRWVPTFPKARYLMARQEFEHFARLHEANPVYPVNHGAWEDSVLPVVASGQAEIVEMNHVVTGDFDDGVWLEPASGHTPGHVTVHVKGQRRDDHLG